MEKQHDILLFGLGAIGGFYAFILNKCKNVRLSVCARSNYDAVETNGITMKSESHGDHNFRPYKVVQTPAETTTKFDYIVCANKAISQDEVTKLLSPCIDEARTAIVILQNGVGNEDPFRNAFPKCTIISGVIWVAACQNVPGVFEQNKSEHLEIGLFPNSHIDPVLEHQRLTTFTSFLSQGGTNFEVFENIQTKRWEKVIWNAAWNSLTALTLLDVQAWFASSKDAIPLSRRVMKEMIDVGRACGVPLEYDLIDTLVNRVIPLGPLNTSMRMDNLNNNPLEIDVILGTAVERGHRLGLSIPTLETIYVILMGVNHRILQSRSSDQK